MKGYDYNILLTAFYAPYIFFEIPSNVACKYFGPKIWIPFLCLGFGVSIVLGRMSSGVVECGVVVG